MRVLKAEEWRQEELLSDQNCFNHQNHLDQLHKLDKNNPGSEHESANYYRSQKINWIKGEDLVY